MPACNNSVTRQTITDGSSQQADTVKLKEEEGYSKCCVSYV